MASGKARKRRKKRSTESYLQAAKTWKKFVPKLSKYNKRKTLKPGEKRSIRHYEKTLQGVTDLQPLTSLQAKRVRKAKLFAPNVRAMRMKVKAGVKKPTGTRSFKITKHGNISAIDQQDRHWLYWPLDRHAVRSKRGMKKAAEAAFQHQFPIELVHELAREAFKKYRVKAVYLWTHSGVTGDGHEDLGSFSLWVNEKWNAGRYMRVNAFSRELQDASDPGQWVNGIAILLEDQKYTERRNQLMKGNPP